MDSKNLQNELSEILYDAFEIENLLQVSKIYCEYCDLTLQKTMTETILKNYSDFLKRICDFEISLYNCKME